MTFMRVSGIKHLIFLSYLYSCESLRSASLSVPQILLFQIQCLQQLADVLNAEPFCVVTGAIGKAVFYLTAAFVDLLLIIPYHLRIYDEMLVILESIQGILHGYYNLMKLPPYRLTGLTALSIDRATTFLPRYPKLHQ